MISLKYNKYMVTGGAGFIGSHICEELLKQDKEVICVDNLVNGKMENMSEFIGNPNFTFLNMDVMDLSVRHFEGVDITFHNAASKCTVCRIDPKKDITVNGWGSLNVFESGYYAGVKKVVHASSGSTMKGKPQSYYGVSKLAGETYLGVLKFYYPDFNYVNLRYYHVYGPRQDNSPRGGVIPIFIRQIYDNEPVTIYGNGKQLRHFSNVKDVVKANFMAVENDKMNCNGYDVIPEWNITINELSVMLHKLMGKKEKNIFTPENPGEIYKFDSSYEKLKALGFKFDVSLESGMKDLIDWYIKQRKK